MESMEISSRQELLDKAGMALSFLCLIHCTALPVLLAVLQVYGASFVPKGLESESFHIVMAFTLLGVGGLAFVQGFRRHGQLIPLIAGGVGTAFLFVGALATSFPEWAEHTITVFGTIVLLFAHVRNRRAGHQGHAHEGPCAAHH